MHQFGFETTQVSDTYAQVLHLFESNQTINSPSQILQIKKEKKETVNLHMLRFECHSLQNMPQDRWNFYRQFRLYMHGIWFWTTLRSLAEYLIPWSDFAAGQHLPYWWPIFVCTKSLIYNIKRIDFFKR